MKKFGARIVVWVGLWLCFSLGPVHSQGAVEATKGDARPNILFIMGDQHRWDALGAAGNPDVKTPHLDSLAADGVIYRNAFSSYPACTPARYSLLSGLPVHRHGGWTNRSTPLPGTALVPALIKERGYRTKAVGKMHFTPTYLDAGFEEMILAEQDGPGRLDDDYHRHLKSIALVDVNDLEDQVKEFRDKAREMYWETFGAIPSNLPDEHYSTTWIADRAIEEIETWEGGGNLLMASFIKPHHPFDPPKPWDELYDPAKVAITPGWIDLCLERDLAFNRGYFQNDTLTLEALRKCIAYYYATITHLDHHIGRMLDLLKEKGLYENTLILYTSDHGDYLGYHHLLLKSNYMYDPVTRIPLVVKFPSSQRKGEASDQMVSNIDVAPTLLAACGLPAPEEMKGVNLIEDRTGHDKIFVEQTPHDVMVRDRRFKLIRSHPANRITMFFDLEKDPFEMTDVYADPGYRNLIDEFEQAIVEWRGDRTQFANHIDHEAPSILGPNVPNPSDDHRAEMQEYFVDKVGAKTP